MTTTYPDRPTVTGDVPDPEVEVLFAEARKRARRRRLGRTGLALAVLAALVATILIVTARDPARTPPAQTGLRTAGATGFPSTFVGYDVDDKTNRGGIMLFDTRTGRAIRTIVPIRQNSDGSTNFSNLRSGFAVSDDALTVFFAETVSEAEPVRIVSARVSGGTPRVLVTGADPAVSSDGNFLAYRPGDPNATDTGFPNGKPVIGILDLDTGASRVITVPGLKNGQNDQYSWLPGSTRLLIASTDVHGRTPGTAQVDGQPSMTKSRAETSRTQFYDTATSRFTTLPAATTAALEETPTSRVTLTGPAQRGDLVRVTGETNETTSRVVRERVGTLDVRAGTLVWTHTLPAGYDIARPAGLAGQSSGRHFLLEGRNGLQPFAWTPSSSKPPTPIDMKLNTTGIAPFA